MFFCARPFVSRLSSAKLFLLALLIVAGSSPWTLQTFAASNAIDASLADVVNGVTIIKDGQQPAPIILVNFPEKGRDRQAFMRIIPNDLDTITGAKFTFAKANLAESDFPRPAIVFTLAPLQDAQGKPLQNDAFRLQTRDGRFYISSETITGLHYGYYHWLTTLGARYWSYNEQDLPSLKTIVVPQTDYTWLPPFRLHDVMSQEAQTKINDFVNKSRSKANLEFTGGHTLYPLLTPYAKTHREIYPLIQTKNKQGKVTSEVRKPNNLHFCYSDPNIAQALADALSKEVEKRRGNVTDYIYFAGMGDWYGGQCMCDRCQKIYAEEKWVKDGKAMSNGFSGSLLRMINKTAEILNQKYPGIQVGTMAYMSFEMPPGKTVPDDNVVIYMPRLRHCGVHDVDTCPVNANFWAGLEQWTKLAPHRVYVWEYGTSFKNFLYPFPTLHSMADNIKAYHRIGVAGMNIQCNYVSTGGYMAVMDNWVWSQLMNDPSQDVDQLINTFTDGYYGPAAKTVRTYIDTLRDSVNNPKPKHANEFSDPYKTYLTKEVFKNISDILATARADAKKSEDPKYFRRVEELAVGVDMADLYTQGPLEVQGDRMVRKDLGDTFERAKALTVNARGASPREWGRAEAYWMNFLSWHGGPMATLTQGSLKVRVVPSQACGFGPVFVDDRKIIQSSSIVILRTGEFVGQPTTTQATTTGEAGVGLWHNEVKSIIEQTFDVVSDKVIKVTSTNTRVFKAKAYENTTIGIRTIIPITKTFKLSYRDSQGEWHDIANKDLVYKKPITLGDVNAFRVSYDDTLGYLDEYQALANAVNDKGILPVIRGEISLDRSKKSVTLVVIVPVRNQIVNKKNDWLSRTITLN